MKCKIVIYLLVVALFSCRTPKVLTSNTEHSSAQKVEILGFTNLYKVDDHLYRSEQPDSKGMLALQRAGIGTVLNVRNFKNDNAEIKGTDLEPVYLPMRAGAISYDDVKNALQVIVKAQKKVLVHCKHGSDRTGCIVAAYRMVVNGWTKEKAINEFLEPRFGYHATWFPNILKFLEKLDIEKLKKELEGVN